MLTVVNDQNGCEASDEVVVTANSDLEAQIAATDISCNSALDGSVMVTASGGVQVDSWSVLENIEISEAIADVRHRARLDSTGVWWNSAN